MRRFYRRRGRFIHPFRPLKGVIWLIGLGILAMTGHWWPGILVLIGLSMVLEAVWRESMPQTFDEDVGQAPLPPASPAPIPPAVGTPIAPAPVTPSHRVDLLPATCPNCGGPARANEVKWAGPQSAVCAFCGSTLPMKKE
jgi:hypothetical protein